MTATDLIDACCEAILNEGPHARVTLTFPEHPVPPFLFLPDDPDSPRGEFVGMSAERAVVSYDALDLLAYTASQRNVGQQTG